MPSFTIQSKSGHERSNATRLEIMRATRSLLDEGNPLAAISVEMIVERAGVSRPTFYRHFRDKQGLMAELAHEVVEWAKSVARSAAESDAEFTRETVDASIAGLVARWRENRRILAAVIEMAEYDERMHETWQAAMHEVAEFAVTIFFGKQDSPRDGLPDDPEMVAEALV